MTEVKYKKISLIIFSFILGLIFANIVSVEMESKTDELWHVNVAKYFTKYSKFPPIGANEASDTYSPYGYSYIDSLDIVYLIAGKFYNLTQNFEKIYFVNFRLFQFVLFAFLLYKIYSLKNNVSLIIVLLLTPQIWHLVSYFNGDFFPLFLSFLITVQLIDKKSSINQYLIQKGYKFSFASNPLFLAICLGLLLISKINYLVFVLFVGLYLLWNWLAEFKSSQYFIKCISVLFISFLVAIPRIVIDFNNNGFNKNEKKIAYAEFYADKNFKPSVYGTYLSSPTISMKKRGVTLTEIFSIYKWHEKSLITLMAEFSYIKIVHFEHYYKAMGFLFSLFGIFFIYLAFFKAEKNNKILFAILVFTIILMISISIYHSWVNDFQPQSRYLFPVLAPIALVLHHNRKNIHNYLYILSIIIASLGVYAYAFHANRYIPKIARLLAS